MNINTRMAVGVHVLVLLALFPEAYFTSEQLSRSVNTNPVVIRRLLGQLKKAGIVTVRPGVGGAALCRAPEEIHLFDIYKAVLPSEHLRPLSLHTAPSPECPVGRNIHRVLELPAAKMMQALESSLSEVSLADIAALIRESEAER